MPYTSIGFNKFIRWLQHLNCRVFKSFRPSTPKNFPEHFHVVTTIQMETSICPNIQMFIFVIKTWNPVSMSCFFNLRKNKQCQLSEDSSEMPCCGCWWNGRQRHRPPEPDPEGYHYLPYFYAERFPSKISASKFETGKSKDTKVGQVNLYKFHSVS